MTTEKSEIVFEASVFMTKYGDQNDLQFYFKICTIKNAQDNCFLDEDAELGFTGATSLEVTKTETVDASAGSML